ncbi:hypothetical protein NDU88_001852 [Pleurodeles waltl]|uniref:Uncharacterized protein n=1 Tax=Pleurodeles waltl TaxID=8319 RepID=A0AAV7KTQ9_PLEWA|nr:hypothetical protein NDU88_001852 [Pleurodeles waltl]
MVEAATARAPAEKIEEWCRRPASVPRVWTESARGVRRGRRYTSCCSLHRMPVASPGLPLERRLGWSPGKGAGDCTEGIPCMSPIKRRPRSLQADINKPGGIRKVSVGPWG